ncbi:glycosyltransferase, partial [Muriicola sp.]
MGLTISYIIIGIYSLALVLIFFYSLAQLNLLLNYLGFKRTQDEAPKFNLLDPKEIPSVTIQLPIYNEEYVVERLLDNISKIAYPKSKLEIQVLDDSTDNSVHQTAKRVAELQESGLDIKHIRRENRQGFKAGALKEGL